VAKVESKGTKVSREDFLRILDEVKPGLAVKENVDQSSSYVFTRGRVLTFNEEVACRASTEFPKEVKGAVKATKMETMLRKFPDEVVEVKFTEKRCTVYGKNKEFWVPLEEEILIPVDAIDKPEKWSKLHEDFTDAVGIVQECATKDASAFTLTCIHIHPKWMEAFDNTQMARYTLKTGVKEPFLVKRDALKHVTAYDFTRFAETGNWLHFKSNTGTVMSVRRYIAESEEYKDLTVMTKVKGVAITLPKTLGAAADRGNEMSKETDDANLVKVFIRPGQLKIIGEGDQGGFKQRMKLKYKGPPYAFRTAPTLLVELLKRYTECEINKDHKLKVDGGKFVYVCCLEELGDA